MPTNDPPVWIAFILERTGPTGGGPGEKAPGPGSRRRYPRGWQRSQGNAEVNGHGKAEHRF
jgi:hypothetical protein